MKTTILRLPHLHFIYISIVLAALLCICILAMDKTALEQELLQHQEEADQLREELNRIRRYSEHYRTTPEIIAAVIRESENRGVNPLIMLELIRRESNFQPAAVSRDGAVGLCQLRPVTAQEAARELCLEYRPEALVDADYSIKLGTYYLAKLVNMYNEDYHRALTAYNRGITGLNRYIKRTGSPVSRYSSQIYNNTLAPAN